MSPGGIGGRSAPGQNPIGMGLGGQGCGGGHSPAGPTGSRYQFNTGPTVAAGSAAFCGAQGAYNAPWQHWSKSGLNWDDGAAVGYGAVAGLQYGGSGAALPSSAAPYGASGFGAFCGSGGPGIAGAGGAFGSGPGTCAGSAVGGSQGCFPSSAHGVAPGGYSSMAGCLNGGYGDEAVGAQEDYGPGAYDLDWQDQRQAEWLERIQAQYFSRWSVDKHDEWQAYQAKFEAAQGGEPVASQPLGPPQWDQLPASRPSAEDTRGAEDYRREHEMQVISAFSSSAVPTPVRSFEASSLPPLVHEEIQRAGFTEPTPIQAQCWPILAAGHDVIGIAKSGSGKTLAFLGPGFAHVLRSRADVLKGPMVLVLAPTRELARQIQLEALKFGRSSGILCCSVTGGEPKGEQLEWLRRGCHVIVATPGRLNEFLEQRHVWLGQVGYAVLDEADRMLDMGFEPQIRRIVEECPKGPERQTLLFSATWPKVVRQLAFDFLRRPVHVHIGEMNAAKANTDVSQHVLLLDRPSDKDQSLEDTLTQHLGSDELAIVFVSTKKACQDVAKRLQVLNFGVTEIHGDKDQRERDVALRSFTEKQKNVMVATDVASRGLDIKGVKLVVNYDAANTPEDYVHRIGRTGRAGDKGIAYTLLVRGDAADIKKARAIAEVMQTAGQVVPDELRQLAGQPVPRGSAKGFRGPGLKAGGKGCRGGFGRASGFKGGRGGFKGVGPKGAGGDVGLSSSFSS